MGRLSWLAAVLVAGAAAQAQAPAPPPPVRSPEVRPDRTVTFRLRAPNAREVRLGGELGQKAPPFEKDAEGVWSLTIGPLEPDLYPYTFLVDGLSIVDPVNPMLKTGVRSHQSLLEVGASPPAFWQMRAVPHGRLHRHFYHSAVAGDVRDVVIYTPPAYDADAKTRYPVLYLLHGAGDHARSWVEVGRANAILDNLLAEGQARPMLVVMPFGHVATGAPRDPSGLSRNIEAFRRDLFEHVMPLVESSYRVLADKDHRAIAGLSMGGGQSLQVGLRAPDRFGWVLSFSGAVFGEYEKAFPELAAQPEQVNRALRLLWIGCGREDRLMEGNRKLSEFLRARGVRHEFVETGGAHTWSVWRAYLHRTLPLLFRPQSPAGRAPAAGGIL